MMAQLLATASTAVSNAVPRQLSLRNSRPERPGPNRRNPWSRCEAAGRPESSQPMPRSHFGSSCFAQGWGLGGGGFSAPPSLASSFGVVAGASLVLQPWLALPWQGCLVASPLSWCLLGHKNFCLRVGGLYYVTANCPWHPEMSHSFGAIVGSPFAVGTSPWFAGSVPIFGGTPAAAPPPPPPPPFICQRGVWAMDLAPYFHTAQEEQELAVLWLPDMAEDW